ncbi:hypothetical protein CWATWH0003_5174 [Crocosphaera watsonii WH 0003]|uniref:Uncharacterized protein n=2 Tax=Crocosphaera watsonii TaxID=263511 RepID=G5JCM0_CROWT|nr:hypothetical protein CWATWH0003_5174 [Crocosphaera watsonii WH 0003]CCQ58219.1 hypothetical protein CWATWH0005_5199 [Crocosphaera watsonii WH 0005]
MDVLKILGGVPESQQALCHTVAIFPITGLAAGRGEFPPKPPYFTL